MAEWLQDKIKIDREKRADMIAHIRNAPHFSRNDKKPWKYQDFLPDGEDEGVSPEEFEQIMLGLVE